MISRITISLAVLFFWNLQCHATVKQGISDSAYLQIKLKKLTVVGSALYIGAHPDDENTAALAYLSLGKGVRTAYLSLTRGEGGQNLIGSEQGDLLGLIRTQELLAARRIDGAEQFFTRAIDFGFSKTAEETLRFWGKDDVLSDVVWIVRTFRPDVILTRFPEDAGGHGNHVASGILALEAFHAAADPTRFPEQLKYVAPWKAKRIVWNRFSWGNVMSNEEKASSVKMEIGDYNPMLGKSYSEIAGIARSMHKSQGFGDSQDRGKITDYYRHTAGEPAQSDLFEGVDLTWNRIPNGKQVGDILQKAYESFRPQKPSDSIPLLLQAFAEMNELPEDPWILKKKEEVQEVIRECAGLWLEAIAPVQSVVPGSEIKISVSAINRSLVPLTLTNIQPATTNAVETRQRAVVCDPACLELKPNEPATRELIVKISSPAPFSNPYWLSEKSGRPLAIVKNQDWIGRPESVPPIRIKFTISINSQTLQYEEPLFFRTIDPVQGELYRSVTIVPAVSVHIKEPLVVFTGSSSKSISVELRSHAAQSGEFQLKAPAGWQVEPNAQTYAFQKAGQTSTLQFKITPGNQAGIALAEAKIDKAPARELIQIEYDHIPPQVLSPHAEIKLIPVDLKTAGKEIGYVMGSGDQIPEALVQVGYHVTLLEEEDLSRSQEFSKFDAIIIGVRAFNAKPELKKYMPRLLEYATQGGTLIVQYQTGQNMDQDGIGPYPFHISRDRVSVEDGPVKILKMDHPVLKTPNVITENDFRKWVQERGLYFPDQWDSQYETVISSNDPGEPPQDGGILYGKVGKGVYIFTSYSWFRQLTAGVPGAYRIFVNLISAGSATAP